MTPKSELLSFVIERAVREALNAYIADNPSMSQLAQGRRGIEIGVSDRLTSTYAILQIQEIMEFKKRAGGNK